MPEEESFSEDGPAKASFLGELPKGGSGSCEGLGLMLIPCPGAGFIQGVLGEAQLGSLAELSSHPGASREWEGFRVIPAGSG